MSDKPAGGSNWWQGPTRVVLYVFAAWVIVTFFIPSIWNQLATWSGGKLPSVPEPGISTQAGAVKKRHQIPPDFQVR